MTELLILQIAEFVEYRRNWKEYVDGASSNRRKKKSGKSSEIMQGFCLVIAKIELNRQGNRWS
jgi:hypothetical protein